MGVRTTATIVTLGLVVAACGGSADEQPAATGAPASEATPTTPEAPETESAELNDAPLTVTSDDGSLALEVPAGAIPDGTEMRIRRIDDPTAAGLPDEAPVVATYELEPDGLVFEEPATARFDFEADGEAPPLLTAIVTEADAWAPAPNQSLAIIDGGVELSTEIDHFSWFAVFDGGVRYEIQPPTVETAVGQEFGAALQRVEVEGNSFVDYADVNAPDGMWDIGNVEGSEERGDDVLEIVTQNSVRATVRCADRGSGRYVWKGEVHIEWSNPLLFGALYDDEYLKFGIGGTATCVPAADDADDSDGSDESDSAAGSDDAGVDTQIEVPDLSFGDPFFVPTEIETFRDEAGNVYILFCFGAPVTQEDLQIFQVYSRALEVAAGPPENPNTFLSITQHDGDFSVAMSREKANLWITEDGKLLWDTGLAVDGGYEGRAGLDLFSQPNASGERETVRFEFDFGTDQSLDEIGAVDVGERFANRVEITTG